MSDRLRCARLAILLPLAAGVAGGCGNRTEANRAAPAPPPVTAVPATAIERTHHMVRQRLGGAANPSFGPAQTYRSAGAIVICGRFQLPGQPSQRYIALGDEDVFLESQMQPGHMDQAVQETCRNA